MARSCPYPTLFYMSHHFKYINKTNFFMYKSDISVSFMDKIGLSPWKKAADYPHLLVKGYTAQPGTFPLTRQASRSIIEPQKTTWEEALCMWFILALLSAVFAALTSILAKIGIDGVNSNLATAIRTMVVVVMAWGMVFLTHAQSGLAEISRKSWLFLILSGAATGISWLCYYKALQLGQASKVVPVDKLSVVLTLIFAFVFLHEQFTTKSLIGCLLIAAGTLVMVL